MCSPLCVFVVDVPKKANAFGGKIRRKPNPKGAQASTRVIPNAPPVRFQSVCRAICRRPSWHVWACPSLTEARPSPVRQKPVGKPVCRPLHVRRGIVCDKPVACPFPVRGKSAAAPPPISECRKMSASDECPPVRRPSIVRILSVSCPSCVRDMTFVSPCSGRQRACSHKGSRSLDEIHYAIWRIFTGGIASSSDFMGRKGLSLFRGPRSFQFGTILSLLM